MKKQQTYLGRGTLSVLPSALASFAGRRLLFVYDELAYTASGAQETIEPLLRDHQQQWGAEILRFCQFSPNPKLEDIQHALATFSSTLPEVVLSLGGGSALDMAKSISLLTTNGGNAREILAAGTALLRDALPQIAIPTTAGTGSEATHFAVVYIDGVKHSIAHETLVPDVAIVDPQLTENLPPQITAATGLDAFCQALESIWAVGATTESLEYAHQALRLAWENLEAVVNRPTPEAREALCAAAHWAGRAINISKTTAPHALSYYLTSRYGIPHGVAVAMTIVPMYQYNLKVTTSDCGDPRGVAAVQQRLHSIARTLGCTSNEQALMSIENLISAIGCPTSLAEAGIDDLDAVQEIARHANLERMSNNPRALDERRLVQALSRPQEL